jgi:hypothetical protein
MHREMERPFKKVSWGEEKFSITVGDSLMSQMWV